MESVGEGWRKAAMFLGRLSSASAVLKVGVSGSSWPRLRFRGREFPSRLASLVANDAEGIDSKRVISVRECSSISWGSREESGSGNLVIFSNTPPQSRLNMEHASCNMVMGSCAPPYHLTEFDPLAGATNHQGVRPHEEILRRNYIWTTGTLHWTRHSFRKNIFELSLRKTDRNRLVLARNVHPLGMPLDST